MVLGRIGDMFSAVSSPWSGPQSSSTSTPQKPSSLSSGSSPPPEATSHDFVISNSASKKYIRHYSSLQDLSAYRTLGLEDGDQKDIGDLATHFIRSHSLHQDSGSSSFSKEKALLGGPPSLPRKNWVRALLLLLCLLVFGFLIYMVSMYIFSYFSQGTPKFYVVLDCGSTGTRVYVYQASVNQKKDGALPIFITSLNEGVQKKSNLQGGRLYDRMETEPGFDKLVNNKSGLRSAINPLLGWAVKQIPEHAHKSTSLYLYATAGLRRLPIADSTWVLDNAWSILKKSPFLCQRDWVKIISGTEEAYYGWIALNHRAGVLGAIPKKLTYGALDLGGSSLQVTFESKKQNESTLNLRIGAVNHHLSAYSLSGYGLNDAFGKSVVHLLKKIPHIKNADLTNGKFELKHPCLQSGFKDKYTCQQCRRTPIAGKNLGKERKTAISLHLIGAPNWEECAALAKVVVNFSEWSTTSSGADCDVEPCALPDNFPRPYGSFFAMSGFFVVYRFFNLSAEATLDDVLEKGREFCEKLWEVAKTSVPPQPFIEQYCFRSPYIVSLLREGLHITDKQVVIGSGSITWTLGVALLEAGKAFSTKVRLPGYEILPMKIKPNILVAIFLISLLFLLCALSYIGNCMPRFLRRPYLPLFRPNNASTVPSPFRFQRWSPISSGKMPLSPTITGSQERPFGLAHGFSSSNSIQMMESSLHPSTEGVSHSYSSSNLGQIHFDSISMGSFWAPHRSQMRLQSRRSQSREDLHSSVAEAHMVKV